MGDICPCCGDWVEYLLNETGWCSTCSLREYGGTQCSTCGAFYSKRAAHDQCWNCRKEAWLTEHADEIEKLIAEGLTPYQAMLRLRDNRRPSCVVCGKELRGAPKPSAKFCKEHQRQAAQYRSLKKSGLSPQDALAITLGSVTTLSS